MRNIYPTLAIRESALWLWKSYNVFITLGKQNGSD